MAGAEHVESTQRWSPSAAGIALDSASGAQLGARAVTPSFVVCFALALAVLAFKAPDSLSNPQFWAEDGLVFFNDQRGVWLPLLFKPYASYLHVIPRTLAWVASGFPITYAPTIYCYSAWLIGAAALASLRELRLAGLPFLVVLAAIALTPTNGEAFGTLTNVHWVLQFYLVTVLARAVRPQGGSSRLHQACTLLVGLSGPFSIFTWGSVLGLAVLCRLPWLARWQLAPITWNSELRCLTIAALTQLVCIAVSNEPAAVSRDPISVEGALNVIAYVQLHAFTVELVSNPTFYAALILIAAAALWLAPDLESRLLLLGIYAFAALQLAGVIAKFSGGMSTALGSMDNGDRYFVMPKAVVLWSVAVVVMGLSVSRPRLRGAALALFTVGPALLYQSRLQRPCFPDRHWAEQAARVIAGETLDVEIHPPGWKVHLEP